MSIEVTARHMDVSSAIQEFARRKAVRMCREFPGIEHVRIILDREKRLRVAEVIVQARNHVRVGAKESSPNMRASISMVVEKAEKQIRKSKARVRDHRQTQKLVERERNRGVES